MVWALFLGAARKEMALRSSLDHCPLSLSMAMFAGLNSLNNGAKLSNCLQVFLVTLLGCLLSAVLLSRVAVI